MYVGSLYVGLAFGIPEPPNLVLSSNLIGVQLWHCWLSAAIRPLQGPILFLPLRQEFSRTTPGFLEGQELQAPRLPYSIPEVSPTDLTQVGGEWWRDSLCTGLEGGQ